ncbi:MAG: hypothetical protein ACI8WB_001166 [Phenylobacterium sp.]|jgi:uncharacterized protein (TIGR00255 family)
MIYSMTAYARREIKGDWGTAIWEIRSVNQRYLETFVRSPEQCRALEPIVRERLRKQLQRGKVEVNLRYTDNPAAASQQQINRPLATQLIDNAKWILDTAGQGQLNPLDILKWPGVMAAEESDMDAINAELLAGFDLLVQDFKQARADEGENLKAMIVQRLDAINEQATTVTEVLPKALEWQRQRLLNRLEEIKAELDPARLEQEMAFLAQKSDVAEELDRLESHVKETRKILNKGGACGRRLDFMMQEFNREANTLGSKSITTDITNASVELKVLIEQMREQIQNIE